MELSAATMSGDGGGKVVGTGKSDLFLLNLDSLSVTQYNKDAMAEWYSIEVFDGASSAGLWAEAHGDPILEVGPLGRRQGLVLAAPQLGRDPRG